MKKLLAVTIIVLLCIAALNSFDYGHGWASDWTVQMHGDEVEGPFGILVGTLMAGGGLLVGFVAIVCAALLVGLLFAGFGMLAVMGVGIAAFVTVVVLVALLSPVLVPVLVIAAIFWFCNRRKHA